MQAIDHTSSQRVRLVDVVKNSTESIIEDLKLVLDEMKPLKPEQRTSRMRSFVKRSKKKLSILLGLCKWSGNPEIPTFFESLFAIESQLADIDAQLNLARDQLYFAHSGLFGRRLRSLDVASAHTILSCGTYDELPHVMFTCGKHPEPRDHPNLREDLDQFLKAKLILHEPVPRAIKRANIENGVVKIHIPHVFEVSLTLQYADDTAPWQVVGFRILADDHPDESESVDPASNGYDVSMFENRVTAFLQIESNSMQSAENIFRFDQDTHERYQHSTSVGVAPSQDVVTGSTVDAYSSHEVASGGSSGLGSSADANLSSLPACNDSSTLMKQNATSALALTHDPVPVPVPPLPSLVTYDASTKPTLSLTRICRICLHAGEAAVLRVLHSQALRIGRSSLWRVGNLLSVDFQDRSDAADVIVRFWRLGGTNSEYRFELRVSQKRPQNAKQPKTVAPEQQREQQQQQRHSGEISSAHFGASSEFSTAEAKADNESTMQVDRGAAEGETSVNVTAAAAGIVIGGGGGDGAGGIGGRDKSNAGDDDDDDAMSVTSMSSMLSISGSEHLRSTSLSIKLRALRNSWVAFNPSTHDQVMGEMDGRLLGVDDGDDDSEARGGSEVGFDFESVSLRRGRVGGGGGGGGSVASQHDVAGDEEEEEEEAAAASVGSYATSGRRSTAATVHRLSRRELEVSRRLWNMDRYVRSSGVAFSLLLRDAMGVCMESALRVLYGCLLLTPAVRNARAQGLRVELEPGCLVMCVGDVQAIFRLDTLTGRLGVQTSLLQSLGAFSLKACDLFMSEANNRDFQKLTSAHLSSAEVVSETERAIDHFSHGDTEYEDTVGAGRYLGAARGGGVGETGYFRHLKPLSTAEMLLQCILAGWWADQLSRVVGAENRAGLVPYLLSQLGLKSGIGSPATPVIGLVFELGRWNSTQGRYADRVAALAAKADSSFERRFPHSIPNTSIILSRGSPGVMDSAAAAAGGVETVEPGNSRKRKADSVAESESAPAEKQVKLSHSSLDRSTERASATASALSPGGDTTPELTLQLLLVFDGLIQGPQAYALLCGHGKHSDDVPSRTGTGSAKVPRLIGASVFDIPRILKYSVLHIFERVEGDVGENNQGVKEKRNEAQKEAEMDVAEGCQTVNQADLAAASVATSMHVRRLVGRALNWRSEVTVPALHPANFGFFSSQSSSSRPPSTSPSVATAISAEPHVHTASAIPDLTPSAAPGLTPSLSSSTRSERDNPVDIIWSNANSFTILQATANHSFTVSFYVDILPPSSPIKATGARGVSTSSGSVGGGLEGKREDSGSRSAMGGAQAMVEARASPGQARTVREADLRGLLDHSVCIARALARIRQFTVGATADPQPPMDGFDGQVPGPPCGVVDDIGFLIVCEEFECSQLQPFHVCSAEERGGSSRSGWSGSSHSGGESGNGSGTVTQLRPYGASTEGNGLEEEAKMTAEATGAGGGGGGGESMELVTESAEISCDQVYDADAVAAQEHDRAVQAATADFHAFTHRLWQAMLSSTFPCPPHAQLSSPPSRSQLLRPGSDEPEAAVPIPSMPPTHASTTVPVEIVTSAVLRPTLMSLVMKLRPLLDFAWQSYRHHLYILKDFTKTLAKRQIQRLKEREEQEKRRREEEERRRQQAPVRRGKGIVIAGLRRDVSDEIDESKEGKKTGTSDAQEASSSAMKLGDDVDDVDGDNDDDDDGDGDDDDVSERRQEAATVDASTCVLSFLHLDLTGADPKAVFQLLTTPSPLLIDPVSEPLQPHSDAASTHAPVSVPNRGSDTLPTRGPQTATLVTSSGDLASTKMQNVPTLPMSQDATAVVSQDSSDTLPVETGKAGAGERAITDVAAQMEPAQIPSDLIFSSTGQSSAASPQISPSALSPSSFPALVADSQQQPLSLSMTLERPPCDIVAFLEVTIQLRGSRSLSLSQSAAGAGTADGPRFRSPSDVPSCYNLSLNHMAVTAVGGAELSVVDPGILRPNDTFPALVKRLLYMLDTLSMVGS